MSWEGVFGVKDQLDAWQECARAALVFAYGLVLVRVAGRRIFGKWSAVDIIVSIMVGSNLSRALTGGAPLLGTLLATTLLMALHWLVSHAAAWWPPVSLLVEGRVIELVRGGKAQRPGMLWAAISDNDLAEALRQSGVEDVSETRLVALEPSGKITVLRVR